MDKCNKHTLETCWNQSDYRMFPKRFHSVSRMNQRLRGKLLSLNISSLVGHITQFISLVDELKPHIITLTETWLKPIHDDSIFMLKDCTGGGVAFLIHNSLKANLLYISIFEHLNQPEFLILDVASRTGPHLLLSVVYRRPTGNLLDEFFEVHSNFMSNYKNLIITGDLNSDLLDSTHVSNHLKNFITELSLYCVPYGATHHVRNKDSWLDVIWLENICKQGVFFKSNQPFISGHDSLFCEYIFEVPNQNEKLVTYRQFYNTNQDALANSLMRSLNIRNISLNDSDPNKLLDFFLTSISALLDEFAPLRTYKVVRPQNPWLSQDLKAKCKERDALYKRAKKIEGPKSFIIFRAKRKELKTELNRARENYLKNELVNLPHGTTIWSRLKHLGLIKTSSSSPLSHFEATDLNNHFASTVRKHPACTIESLNSLFLSNRNQVDVIFEWNEIDIVEVTKALHITIQKSKGKSPDELDLKWLKNHIPQISYCLIFLTALFNRSLETGIFPQAWKTIFIIPLNRTSPPRTMSDTRPIANTSHLSKVFERLVTNQVVKYLEDNELLDKYQSGFRKNYDTQSALLKLVDDVIG